MEIINLFIREKFFLLFKSLNQFSAVDISAWHNVYSSVEYFKSKFTNDTICIRVHTLNLPVHIIGANTAYGHHN